MKVAHVITGTNIGGAEVMLARYLQALGPAAASHSVLSLLPPGPIYARIEQLGVPIKTLNFPVGGWSLGGFLKLRQTISRSAPDVVHGWMYHGCLAAYAGLSGRIRNRPALVWGIHHSLNDLSKEKPSTRRILRMLVRCSHKPDLITFCAARALQEHAAIGFRNDRTMVIANAVNAQEFRPDPAAKARLAALCNYPEDRIVIGTVTRNHPMKDHAAMVGAVAELVRAGRNVQAVLVGTSATGGEARDAARRLGIDDRVSTPGERHDIAALVPGFDVFVMCSAWGDSWSIAAAEAMAAGVPCIVTSLGDCPMLVGDTGFVVPPSDPVALAAALLSVVDKPPEDRHRMGAAARRRVASLFDFPRYIEAHDAAYRQARPLG